jgi:hypothetical protein
MTNQDTPPDIFISYAQEDGNDARRIAGFLDSCGYEVWWDRKLVSGSNFRKEILNALTRARAAIVIWTPNSVESNWVIEEAEEAREANKLIALRQDALDYRSIPLGFRSVQTDLVGEHERIVTALERLGIPPKQKPWIEPAPETATDDRIARLEQLERWDSIKNGKDPRALSQFLAQYPRGPYSAQARTELSRLAADAWRQIGGSQDVAAFEEFIRIFPDDVRTAEARRLLDALRLRREELESWERVKKGADIAAIEAHVFRFPGGSTAAAARDLLQSLYLERHAAEHWRAIEHSNQVEDFDQFLEVYSASSYAVRARQRRDELRRAREEEDWQGIQHERHATPIIGFVRRYHDGRHARDAIRLLEELPGKVEEEAWAQIKDCREPAVFEAFLTAFPGGKHAGDARARRVGPPVAAPDKGSQKPERSRAASPARRRRWPKIVLWTVIALLALVLLYTTAIAITEMPRQFSNSVVAVALLVSSLAISGIALLLMIFGPRLYPSKDGDEVPRKFLFAAIAAILVLGWMAATQTIGEFNHQFWSGIDNIRTGMAVLLFVIIVVVIATAVVSHRFPRLRFVFYVLTLLVAAAMFFSSIGLMNELLARDYRVTTYLFVFGGCSVMALTAIASVRDLVRRRRA